MCWLATFRSRWPTRLHHVDAALRLDQLGAEVGQAATAGGPVRQLARVGLGIREQFRDRPDRHRGVYHQNIADVHGAQDRREVFLRVVGHLRVDAHVDRQRRDVAKQQGVAVGWRLGHDAGADTKRNGVTTLFAAMNMLTGEVLSITDQLHRHQEWLRLLKMIVSVQARHLDLT